MINVTQKSEENSDNKKNNLKSSVEIKTLTDISHTDSDHLTQHKPQQNTGPSNSSEMPPQNSSKKTKRKFSFRTLVGVAVLALLILGSGAGFYLTQFTQQDIRQQAYTEPGTCTPNNGCEYSCSGSHPVSVGINCNLTNSDCGTTRPTDICRGKKTGGNCQLCEKPGGGYACPGDPLAQENCDYSCACAGADQGKCYESGIGHSSGKETPGYDCKNIQKDVLYQGSHVWNCTSEDGRAWDECNTPEEPQATFTSACTPNQAYSPDGSALSYDFTVSNVVPSAGFERTVVFLSIGGNKMNATQEQSFEATFGKPTWASNGANPTCVNTGWCGYWLKSTYTYAPSMKMVFNNSTIIGGSNGSKTIKDLVAWGEANGITNWTVDANIVVNGVQNDSLGGKTIQVTADACEQPEPVPQKCNDTCETNAECQDINPNFICSAAHGNRCRLESNPSSQTCEEVVEEPVMCQDVAILDQNNNELNPTASPSPFSIGQVIKFRCAADDPTSPLIEKFEFRITEPDGTVVQGGTINPGGKSAISQNYQITQNGTFTAQCRICETDGTCQPYVSIGAN